MNFSRRDTIIIAVLINLGLLSVLLMTALHIEGEKEAAPHTDMPPTIASINQQVETVIPQVAPISLVQTAHDEVDQAMRQQVTLSEAAKEEPCEAGYLEITVKRGDALEKIARANGTTVRELRQLNDLPSDKLKIGQILRVPVVKKILEKSIQENDEEGVYVMQSGDNPWKIARKFQVKYEDILLLNDIDEQKARNLKPGDKIRVR